MHAIEDETRIVCERPLLPPVLIVALSMWAASAASMSCLQKATSFQCLLLGAGAFAMLVIAAVYLLIRFRLARRRKLQAAQKTWHLVIALVGIGALVGVGLGASHAAQVHTQSAALGQGIEGSYEFVVVEDPSAGDFGDTAIARTQVPDIGQILVRVSLPSQSDLPCWSRFKATCSIRSAQDSFGDSAWRKGCAGKASIKHLTRIDNASVFAIIGQLRAGVLNAWHAFDNEGAMLVESIALGSRQRLFESDVYTDVKGAGLAHIVAVSGAHLAIVSSFVAFVARLIHMKRRSAIALQLLIIVTFLVLAGAPHSALRAALMASCALGSIFVQRRSWPLNALGICIACLLLTRPALAVSVSFALSGLSTLSILLFSRYIALWFLFVTSGRAEWLCELLGMCCAAIVGTAPLAWGMFGQFSLIAPLSGVIAVPACVILCIGGLFSSVLSLAVPSLGCIALQLMVDLGDVFTRLIHILASLPGAFIGIPWESGILALVFGVGACALYVVWPMPSKKGLVHLFAGVSIVVTLSMVLAPRLHGDELIMLDVGQGDAFVLRSGVQVVLVDTGNQDARVIKALARHDIRSIELLVITHPDDDHCGSLDAICSTVDVNDYTREKGNFDKNFRYI